MIKNIIENNKNVDINTNKINKLKELFPNCFNSNGDFDISVFEEELKTNASIIKEGYGLNFLGKNYAKYVASLDTETILVPDEENNNKDENKNSENIYISGDNIDALKHLVKSYSGQIKCIYIDPPYNTGNDGFVYSDKFNLSIEKLIEVLDINEDEAKRVFDMTNSKSNSHSAWLTFMYPRLYVAKQLLKETGVIFISIGQEEISNLINLCNSVFGEENKISVISRVTKTASNSGTYFAPSIDYVLCYAKNIDKIEKFVDLVDESLYKKIEADGPRKGEKYRDDVALYQASLDDWRPNQKYFIECPDGSKVIPPCKNLNEVMEDGDGRWRWTKEKYLENIDLLVFKKTSKSPLLDENGNKAKYNVYTKSYLNDRQEDGTLPREIWDQFINRKGADLLKKYEIPFSFSKPFEMISYIFDIIDIKDGDIVLDFFAGSATTAESAMRNKKNIKYILVQLPEDLNKNYNSSDNSGKKIIKEQIELLKRINKPLFLDEIGQERIRRAAKKIKEETNADIDYGFKHYTIKDVNTNTLDKLEKFEPNYVISDGSILDEFGINAVLTTWMNEDGYGLTDNYEKLELEDYTAYKCQNTIYLLNWNISDLFIKALIEKYEKDENFDCNRIVMFGYSFTLNEIQTLKDNLQQVKNIKGINVEVITRY